MDRQTETLAEKSKAVNEILKQLYGTKEPDHLQAALIALQYMNETDYPNYSNNMDHASKLALRIQSEMPNVDEPRFSWYDYVDGIVHATYGEVNMDKLLALDETAFAESLIWLANYKRETYEERPHEDEPLQHDIWD